MEWSSDARSVSSDSAESSDFSTYAASSESGSAAACWLFVVTGRIATKATTSAQATAVAGMNHFLRSHASKPTGSGSSRIARRTLLAKNGAAFGSRALPSNSQSSSCSSWFMAVRKTAILAGSCKIFSSAASGLFAKGRLCTGRTTAKIKTQGNVRTTRRTPILLPVSRQ